MFSVWVFEFKLALIEFIKNPVSYWIIALFIILGRQRQKLEVKQFGRKMNSLFSSLLNLTFIGLFSSVFLSTFAIYFGVVVTYEFIIVATVITILLSIVYQQVFLSIAYTLGATFFILYLSTKHLYSESNAIFLSILLLIGMLLIIESILLITTKKHHYYIEQRVTPRGKLYGQFFLEKMLIVPVFMFVPDGNLFAILPLFSIGDEQYSLTLFPVVLGFSFIAKQQLPKSLLQKLSQQIFLLGAFIIAMTVVSYFYLSLIPFIILLAIIGRLTIQFRSVSKEKLAVPYFFEMDNTPTIFWVYANSPAEKAGLKIGDTIVKINGEKVTTIEDVDNLLIRFKDEYLTIVFRDKNYTLKTSRRPIYANNRQQLGIKFIQKE